MALSHFLSHSFSLTYSGVRVIPGMVGGNVQFTIPTGLEEKGYACVTKSEVDLLALLQEGIACRMTSRRCAMRKLGGNQTSVQR